MSNIKRTLESVALLLVFLPGIAGSQGALAQTSKISACYQTSNTEPKNPLCVANEIDSIDFEVLSFEDGCDSTTDTATIIVGANIEANAKERYDTGFWINTKGGDVVTDTTPGACYTDFLDAQNSNPYSDLDGDSCGDVDNKANAPNTTWASNAIEVACLGKDQIDFDSINFDYMATWKNNKNETCDGLTDAL